MGELSGAILKPNQQFEGFFSALKKKILAKPQADIAAHKLAIEKTTTAFNGRHPFIPFMANELFKLRGNFDDEQRKLKEDFMERYVISRISSDIALQEYKKHGGSEPKLKESNLARKIRFNNPSDRKIFNVLWSDFISSGPKENPVDTHNRLDRLFIFWRDHAKPFPEVKLHIRPVMRNFIARPA